MATYTLLENLDDAPQVYKDYVAKHGLETKETLHKGVVIKKSVFLKFEAKGKDAVFQSYELEVNQLNTEEAPDKEATLFQQIADEWELNN